MYFNLEAFFFLFSGKPSKKNYHYYSMLSTLSEVQEVQYTTLLIPSDATLSVLVLLGITRQFALRLTMLVLGSYIGSSFSYIAWVVFYIYLGTNFYFYIYYKQPH